MLLEVLYEDNHCIVVNKPAGISSTHFQGKEETLDRVVKHYLKQKYKKPGNVYLGIVHRLDKPVSGVLLFARTSKAAARLAEQFRSGTVQKVYWAVIEGQIDPPNGTLENWLLTDRETGRVSVVDAASPGARRALLTYSWRAMHRGFTWLELRPATGRKHQLRVQLAHRGVPIYGDTKYGSPHRLREAIALHARSLTFVHPIRRVPLTVMAEAPDGWSVWLSRSPR